MPTGPAGSRSTALPSSARWRTGSTCSGWSGPRKASRAGSTGSPPLPRWCSSSSCWALLEVGQFTKRLGRAGAFSPLRARRCWPANREIGRQVRRFMAVRTLCQRAHRVRRLGASPKIAGLELAVAWGAIAFALNYIPFLGPLIATLFPTHVRHGAVRITGRWRCSCSSASTSSSSSSAAISSRCSPAPRWRSRRLAVIFAVFFWSFMWGIAGALHRRADPDRARRLLRGEPVISVGRRAARKVSGPSAAVASCPRENHFLATASLRF